MFESLSKITTKKIRMNWQGSETFCQRKTSSPSTMINKLKLTLTSFFAIEFGFSKTERKKDGSDFELNTVSSFQSTRVSHW